MAKGDDAVLRKKNKSIRKKQQRDSSNSVSARVASIIEAKKRRQSGKRRQCQGMCYSLPTPDDPFNDRHGKEGFKNKKINKNKKVNSSSQVDEKMATKTKVVDSNKRMVSDRNAGMEIELNEKGGLNGDQKQEQEDSDCPSKFLVLCLNAIEKGLQRVTIGDNEESQPLFSNSWGVEFLKWYSIGENILETNGSSSSFEQIAWIVSIAADAIVRKEKKNIIVSNPFLLYLVPSQEKALEVRTVCKHLKALGIHTVSLHPGVAVDHQINGLRSCEPEFLVSTPERLLELHTLEAIDVSGVSFLVVDGAGCFDKDGFMSAVRSIRQMIYGNPYTVVFEDGRSCDAELKLLVRGSIRRLCQGGCIQQDIVCDLDDDK